MTKKKQKETINQQQDLFFEESYVGGRGESPLLQPKRVIIEAL